MAKFVYLVLFSVLVVSLRIFNATPITDFKKELNLVGDLKQDLADSNRCEDERADCYIIANITGGGGKLQTYCNKWRDDPAVKLCKRTCSFCSKPPYPTAEPETEKPETMKPSETPKPTQPSVETFSGFQKTCLEAHNAFRAFHGVPPLKWSSKLSRDAQEWADHLASIGDIYHDPTARGKDQGENLYYEIPADRRPKRLCGYDENQADCLSCEHIVQLWYNEEEDYDYNTGEAKKPGAVILHFTQLIWKASTELGMATAVSAKKGNMLVAVARYSPVGNWLGEFQENVPPTQFALKEPKKEKDAMRGVIQH